jgi:hypothetical protein
MIVDYQNAQARWSKGIHVLFKSYGGALMNQQLCEVFSARMIKCREIRS